MLSFDPYPHQPDSEDKSRRITEDLDFLCKLFEKSEEDVISAGQRFSEQAHLMATIFAFRGWQHAADFEFTKDATTYPVASMLFTVEGVYRNVRGSSNRIKKFLKEHTSRSDQITLLTSFAFTDTYTLGQSHGSYRHIMHKDAIASRNHEIPDEYCWTNTDHRPWCICHDWLIESPDIDLSQYLNRLGDLLYCMRNAITHDGQHVMFVYPESDRDPSVSNWSMSIYDAVGLQDGSFMSYESGLGKDKLRDIFLRSMWTSFSQGTN